MLRAGVVRAAACAAPLLLASCDAADFAKPIGGFSEAAKSAQSSLVAKQNSLDTQILDYSLAVAQASDGPLVKTVDDDCSIAAQRCRLYVEVDGLKWPFTKGRLDHNVVVVMDALVAYAAGLAEIAKSQSAKEIQNATNTTKTRVISLAGSIDDIQKELTGASSNLKGQITPFATPITGLVSFALQRYTERIKVRALREAVSDMEQIIDEVVFAFDEIAGAAGEIELAILDEKYSEARKKYSANPHSKTTLTELKTAADAFDQGLQKPNTLFSGLREAHGALYSSLVKGDLSFAELWPKLQAVFDETAKIAGLVKQLADAAQPQGT
jgi:hypothetical protein